MEPFRTNDDGGRLRDDVPTEYSATARRAKAQVMPASNESRGSQRGSAAPTESSVRYPRAEPGKNRASERGEDPSQGDLRLADVSIITTCKGRLNHLQRALPTMLDQGAKEVIVVDYADPDDAGNWAKREYGDCVKVVRPDPPDQYYHRSHARNVGAMAASGSMLAFVDADSILNPGWLRECRSRLTEACAVWTNIHTEGFDAANSGTMLCRADAFHAARGYDESLVGYGHEDTDLRRRLRAHGGEATYKNALIRTIEHGHAERVEHHANKNLRAAHNANRRRVRQRTGPVNSSGYGRRSRRLQLVILTPWMIRGGAERVNLDILEAMSEAGWDCTVITTRRPPDDHAWAEQTREHADLIQLEHIRQGEAKRRIIAGLCQQADAVLVNNTKIGYEALPLIGPNVYKAAIIHDTAGAHNWAVEKRAHLDRIITVSDLLTRDVMRKGVNPDKIRTIPWAANAERFYRDEQKRRTFRECLDLKDNDFMMLFPARVSSEKRQRIAVRTAAKLPEWAKLVILGKGPDEAPVRRLMEELQLGERVRMIGGVPDADMPGYHNAADVVISCSRSEALPVVFQEAMNTAKPIIGPAIGAVHELVTPDCGTLIEQIGGDAEAELYADAIRLLMYDPDKALRRGEGGRQRTAQWFSMQRVHWQIVSAFAEPARRRQSPRRFVLLGMARSGTTMLDRALDAHPQVSCRGEIFNEHAKSDEAVRMLRSMPSVEYAETMGWGRNGPNIRAAGFKHLHEMRGLTELAADTPLPIVLVYRRNQLERFASFRKMAGRITGQPINTLSPSPEDMKGWLWGEPRQYEEMKHAFRFHPMIEVIYERLIDPTTADAEWRKVTDFLGVDPSSWNPPTQKREKQSMREVFANFDELAKHFANTRWGWMFDREQRDL